MKSWFKINAKDDGGLVEVQILDEIGGWGVTGRTFITQLKDAIVSASDKIHLLINSPGGSVIEGNFIYNELVKLENHLTVEISGMAASMASIISMAADEILIHENSYLMIHNPWTFAMGESEDLRRMADLMDKMKGSAVKAYQRHTDLSESKISELMDDETWLDGLEAVAMGFATRMLEPLEIAACAKTVPDSVKAVVMGEAVTELVNSQEEPPELTLEQQTAIACTMTEKHTEAVASLVIANDKIDVLEARLEKQDETCKALQSEKDKAKSELSKVETEKTDMQARLSRLTAPGFTFTGESNVATWDDAKKACDGDYVAARKQYPDLYKAYMSEVNKKKKN